MIDDQKDRWQVVEIAWQAIVETVARFKEKYLDIQFDQGAYSIFGQLFQEKYQDIMSRFMNPETNALDAHKQAALITICCLESKAIKHNVKNDNQISIVPQVIAVTVGLSYMKDRLNELLKRKKIGKQLKEYYLPVALACDTPYLEIISRILYYEEHEEDMQFCVLELSDRFFLLEYINLLQQGIEPSMLKE